MPAYLELLSAGGSTSPEELGEIVGVDLADPGFWDAGLDARRAQARRRRAGGARRARAPARSARPRPPADAARARHASLRAARSAISSSRTLW